MGYYSEVAIALKKSDYAKLVECAEKENNYQLLDFIEEGEANAPQSPNEDIVRLYWSDVEWSRNDGHFVEEFINHKIDKYDFIRLGEKYTDIEYNFGLSERNFWLKSEIMFF